MSVLTKKLTKIDKELLVLEKNVYILQRILVLAGSITYQQSPVYLLYHFMSPYILFKQAWFRSENLAKQLNWCQK